MRPLPLTRRLFSKSSPKRLKPTSRVSSCRFSLTGRSTRLRLEPSRPEGRGSLGSTALSCIFPMQIADAVVPLLAPYLHDLVSVHPPPGCMSRPSHDLAQVDRESVKDQPIVKD